MKSRELSSLIYVPMPFNALLSTRQYNLYNYKIGQIPFFTRKHPSRSICAFLKVTWRDTIHYICWIPSQIIWDFKNIARFLASWVKVIFYSSHSPCIHHVKKEVLRNFPISSGLWRAFGFCYDIVLSTASSCESTSRGFSTHSSSSIVKRVRIFTVHTLDTIMIRVICFHGIIGLLAMLLLPFSRLVTVMIKLAR